MQSKKAARLSVHNDEYIMKNPSERARYFLYSRKQMQQAVSQNEGDGKLRTAGLRTPPSGEEIGLGGAGVVDGRV